MLDIVLWWCAFDTCCMCPRQREAQVDGEERGKISQRGIKSRTHRKGICDRRTEALVVGLWEILELNRVPECERERHRMVHSEWLWVASCGYGCHKVCYVCLQHVQQQKQQQQPHWRACSKVAESAAWLKANSEWRMASALQTVELLSGQRCWARRSQQVTVCVCDQIAWHNR